ncbi:DUF1917-domain-containing protein [Amniculicola lignicola CBS 123094]|uniref:DUF1917-domain-containing protein n=1 Tax=Amniculicola lignicola CBS 123094 TaxID=1392246 RepID=A0A6A5X4I8_9PLEO|nr:DUF1917-domain-containing protein [Amniculicola lignicola CBS 123094]
MEEEELVPGDGWISDDSSFYGDDEEQERLLLLCEDFNLTPFWEAHKQDLNCVLVKTRAMPPPDLFNPLQGRPDAWQLEETVDDFIKRLPPLTTSASVVEWIWVSNPHRSAQIQSGPMHVADLVRRGSQLLKHSLEDREDVQAQSFQKAQGTVMRMLHQAGEDLKTRLNELAAQTNVISGKWMLYPKPEDLTPVWRLVIEAVINNRLGPTAKVAPNNGRTGDRLICVYTKDFRDTEDVLRVLKELCTMSLAGSGQPIYYKSDVYTYLNIYGSNASEYGLKASLYSSQTMLASASLPPPKAPQNMQSTLEAFRGF